MLSIDTKGDLTVVASGGTRPISITGRDGIVYVVNQGNANTSVDRLEAIPGSIRPLSGSGDVHPTDIAFTPDGAFVIVAERFTSRLDTVKVVNGVARSGNVQASAECSRSRSTSGYHRAEQCWRDRPRGVP